MSVTTDTSSFDSQMLDRRPWFLIPLLGGLFGSLAFLIGLVLVADSLTTQQKTDWIVRGVLALIGCILVGIYMFLRYSGKSRIGSLGTVFGFTMFITALSSNEVAHLVFAPLRWF